MRFTGFIGPSYVLRSVNVDCQRCINLYPEMDELGTGKEREVAALVSTPGLSLLFTTAVTGPIRGLFYTSKGVLFVVSKNKLYSVNSLWAATEVGTLTTSTGQVGMADNGFQLMIVDGPSGYVYNFATLAFTVISDPAFTGANQVCFQDGYFIFNKPGTEQFGITGINEVTFDALDFGSAEANPDPIVGLLSDHRQVWLFGSNSIEVFFNSGDANFPFQRIEGAFVEHGCAAAFSIAKMNNTVFWLGQDDKGKGMVFQAKGYQPQRISTHAVEYAIQGYGDVSDAVGYTYQENGHHFYVLNFSKANTTWVFDASTNLWHERTYTNNGVLERHRGNCHAFAYGKHVVGDYQNGNVYELSSSVYSDNGREIIRRRVTPHISQDMVRNFFQSFQLDMETGTGLDGLTQGVDPKVVLEFSDDGGHSWSNEKWANAGKIGQTKKRVMWRRLGYARDRVFRISISDPVKVTLIGAELFIYPGVS